MLICAYGALIKEPLLSEHEMLNVHPSLLPRWRGAAPIERAIEAGDEETGRDHHAARPPSSTPGRSACSAPRRSIPTTTTARLAGRLAALGGELLVEALDTEPAFRDQPEHGRDLRREDRARATACSTRSAPPTSSSGACAR